MGESGEGFRREDRLISSQHAEMSRKEIRIMKRAIRAGDIDRASEGEHQRARESALALLARSIKFGHRRLALVRLAMAVRAGAAVTREQWAYCEEAVSRSGDSALREMLETAMRSGAPSVLPSEQAAAVS